MEHKSDWFLEMNPNGFVPAMKEEIEGKEDFKLFEHAAIMKYICHSRNLDDHWYPRSDPVKAARIDSYMHW